MMMMMMIIIIIIIIIIILIVITIIISGIYKAHLISQRTSQCASLLLRYQENRHNHFASTRLQLAKRMPYRHFIVIFSHERYLSDALRYTRQMRVKCHAQVHNTRISKHDDIFGLVQWCRFRSGDLPH